MSELHDTDPDPEVTPIRETYEEFEIEGTWVALIADPRNTHAWVQSDEVVEVRQ